MAITTAGMGAGPTTFIYISVGGVIMYDRGSPIHNVNESAPQFPTSFSAYNTSKARGEEAVLAASGRGFRTIAIRPPAIWGPGDPFSRGLTDAIASGSFAFIERGDYPFATCHVDNAIEAVQCALERGTSGRAYFIRDHEITTFREFIAMLADLRGASIEGLKSVSYRLAVIIGPLIETSSGTRVARKEPA